MRYLSAVCFLAIVAFADASPAAAQHELAPVSLDTTLSTGTEKEWPS